MNTPGSSNSPPLDRLSWKAAILAGLGLIVILAILFPAVFFSGESFFFRDVARNYLSEKMYQGETIRKGFWPFWNPLLFAGIPHHATLEAGLYYPLNVLFWITPYERWFTFNTLLHLWLGGMGVWLWLSVLSLPIPLSILGAWSFPCLGMITASIEFFPMVACLALMPWIWASLALASENSCRSRGWAGLAGLLTGCQILANYPTLTVYTFLLEGFWILERGTKIARGAGIAAITLALGLLIGSIQLIPTAELTLQSVRGTGLPYQQAIEVSCYPIQLLSMFVTPTSPQPFFHLPFLGVILFGGALAGRSRLLWAGVLLFAVAALGPATPVHWALYQYVPTFAFERKPINLLIMVSWLVFLLSARGWSFMTTPGVDSSFQGTCGRVWQTAIAALAVLTGLTAMYFHETSQAAIRLLGPGFPFFNPDGSGAILRTLVVTLLATSFLYLTRFLSLRRLVLTALGVVFLFELGGSATQVQPTTGPDFFRNVPATVQNIRNVLATPAARETPSPSGRYPQSGYERLFLPDSVYQAAVLRSYPGLLGAGTNTGLSPALQEWKDSMESRFPMNFGLADAKGNGSIIPKRYLQIVDTWDAQYGNATQPDIRLLQILGVRFFLTSNTLRTPDLESVSRSRFNLYQLKSRKERFWWATSWEPQPTDPWLFLQRLQAPEFPWQERVLLNVAPEVLPSPSSEASITFHLSENPNRLVFSIQSSGDGLLVIQDQWYPGWHARVDGLETPILLANGVFRAVPVLSGAHSLELFYIPSFWHESLFLAFLGLLATGLMILFPGNPGSKICEVTIPREAP